MFLKKIDILSSQITLYNKGLLYHSSVISILLSIISFFMIIVVFALELLSFFFHLDKPKVNYYNTFSEESGTIPINSSSLFHFISINRDVNNQNDQEFDFESFRIIGFETYLEDYISDKKLSKFDHWLYGPCNNETDTQGISYLITQEYFTKSACIRKYYSLREQKYFDTEHPNFRWPTIEQGNNLFRKKFYSIIIEKCEEDTINLIFNNSRQCKNDSNFKNIFEYGSIYFNFIDNNVQNDNHFIPINKYFNRIENKLSKDNYCINHLYFNPIFLFTNYYGIFKNTNATDYSYTLERNDIYIINQQNKDKNIFMGYYLWLNKRINSYNRDYMTLTETISNIGGISSVIISVFLYINKIFNYYAILSDTGELLNSFSVPINKINQKKEIKFGNLKTQNINMNMNLNRSYVKEIKINSNMEKNLSYSRCKSLEKNAIISPNENISNLACINDKVYKYECIERDINKENDNFNFIDKKEKINFCKYFINKITFGKSYKNIQAYQNFRIRFLSIENLLKCYLNINNLTKINKIKWK